MRQIILFLKFENTGFFYKFSLLFIITKCNICRYIRLHMKKYAQGFIIKQLFEHGYFCLVKCLFRDILEFSEYSFRVNIEGILKSALLYF